MRTDVAPNLFRAAALLRSCSRKRNTDNSSFDVPEDLDVESQTSVYAEILSSILSTVAPFVTPPHTWAREDYSPEIDVSIYSAADETSYPGALLETVENVDDLVFQAPIIDMPLEVRTIRAKFQLVGWGTPTPVRDSDFLEE